MLQRVEASKPEEEAFSWVGCSGWALEVDQMFPTCSFARFALFDVFIVDLHAPITACFNMLGAPARCPYTDSYVCTCSLDCSVLF